MKETERSEKGRNIKEEKINKHKMNNKNLSKMIYIIIGILIMVLQKPAYSQLNFYSGADFVIDDNINGNYQKIFDRDVEMYLGAGININSGNDGVLLNYFGLYNYYTINKNYSYHYHNAIVSYYDNRLSSNLLMDLTASYSLSLNTEDYSYLNNWAVGLTTVLNYSPSFRNSYIFSMNLNFTRFDEMKEFSNVKLISGLKSLYLLSKKTMMGGELQIGLKKYVSQYSMSEGQGKGKKGKSDNDNMNVYLVKGLTEIEHSFSRNTLMKIGLEYQRNFMDNNLYLSSNQYSGNINQLDDEFSYNGYAAMLEFQQRFFSDLTGKISFDFERKEFLNRPAYNLNDLIISPERIDNLYQVDINIEKRFSAFLLGVKYEYVRNESNDEWFNSSNNIYSLKLSVEF